MGQWQSWNLGTPLLVVAVGEDLWQSPPQTGFCSPGGPAREKIVSLLHSQAASGAPVRERRTKGCTVGKEPGLVTGLIGSESH